MLASRCLKYTTRNTFGRSYLLHSYFQIRFKNIIPPSQSSHIISNLVSRQKYTEAIELFQKLKNDGEEFRLVDYNRVIDVHFRLKQPAAAEETFEELKKKFKPNVYTLNLILNGYVKLGELSKAKILFEKMLNQEDEYPEPDIYTYNIILDGYVREKMNDEIAIILDKMKETKHKPNAVTENIVIKGFLLENNINEAIQLFNALSECGTPTYNIMIDYYSKNKMMKEAQELFDKMDEKNISKNHKTYECMISGYISNNEFEKATELIVEALQKKIIFSNDTVVSFSLFLENEGKQELANQLKETLGAYRRKHKNQIVADEVERLVEIGEPEKAERYFRDNYITRRQYVKQSLIALIKGYCNAKQIEKAINIYNEMRLKHGLAGNKFCTKAFASYFKQVSVPTAIDDIKNLKIRSKMERNPDVLVVMPLLMNAFSVVHATNPHLENILHQLLEAGIRLDPSNFSRIITGNFSKRDPNRGEEWFHKIKDFKIKYDSSNFEAIIRGFVPINNTKKIMEYYNLAKEMNIKLTTKTYISMIKKFIAKDEKETARKLLKELEKQEIYPKTRNSVIRRLKQMVY